MSSAQLRADIQGLRGVAVLAVTAVHAWPEALRGGFVGVDMFFVLSGYLISTVLFREAEAGRIDLRGFYARRIRRLFPSLLVVLAASLVATVLLTFPNQTQQIGRHVAAGATFLSNVALWREAGYFDASSETKPLLHLWSLGIEEQFYILWPLAALLVVRWRRAGAWLLLALLLGSFLLNVVWVVEKAKGTFFLLPTRAWELLIGAAWAWLSCSPAAPNWAMRWHRAPAALRDAAAVLGAVLIALAFAWLDPGRAFPGWWALLPTLGTVLLLAAGPQAALNRMVLSHPILVFYGGISYPLYLWHWPLLVFPQLAGVEMDNAVRVVMLTASVGLAALTLELEQPVRAGRFGRAAVPALCAGMVLVGLGGAALVVSDGWMARLPATLQPIARAEFGVDYTLYRAGQCFLDLEQGPESFEPGCAAPVPRPGVLLWGDSHAAAMYPGLQAVVPALAQLTKARCPPLTTPPAGASRGCAQTQAHAWRLIRERPPETVVLGGHWSLYAKHSGDSRLTQELLRTVAALKAAGVQRVVLIGHLPTWTRPLPTLLLAAWRESGEVPERLATRLDARALQIDEHIRHALAGSGAVFISPHDALCDARGCQTTQQRAGLPRPLALDESHLSADGSALLVDRSRALLLH